MSLLDKLIELKPSILPDVQAVYDEWEQDHRGISDVYGCGGICDEIANAIADALSSNGIDVCTPHAQVGENHTWVIAYDENTKEAYDIDIPYGLYESGGGYCWKKKLGVIFYAEHIMIYPTEYENVVNYLEDL